MTQHLIRTNRIQQLKAIHLGHHNVTDDDIYSVVVQ